MSGWLTGETHNVEIIFISLEWKNSSNLVTRIDDLSDGNDLVLVRFKLTDMNGLSGGRRFVAINVE